jgi:transposase
MHAGFSSGDRQRLRKALTRVRRARPFRRLQALLWLAEGRSISEVARLARASRVSIYNWCTAYQQAGRGRKLAALLEEKPRSGRPRQIGPQAEQVLQNALEQSPLDLQYQSPGWTLALLATHLQKCCGGPRPSPDALRRRLHALHWRWKRPRYVFRQPDPQRAKKNARS